MSITLPAAEPVVFTVPATATHDQIERAIDRLSLPAGYTPADYATDAAARAVWDAALTARTYTTGQARRMAAALHARLTASRPITGPCSTCPDWWPLTALDDDAVCPDCRHLD